MQISYPPKYIFSHWSVFCVSSTPIGKITPFNCRARLFKSFPESALFGISDFFQFVVVWIEIWEVPSPLLRDKNFWLGEKCDINIFNAYCEKDKNPLTTARFCIRKSMSGSSPSVSPSTALTFILKNQRITKKHLWNFNISIMGFLKTSVPFTGWSLVNYEEFAKKNCVARWNWSQPAVEIEQKYNLKKTLSGGIEPPTYWLTVKRSTNWATKAMGTNSAPTLLTLFARM